MNYTKASYVLTRIRVILVFFFIFLTATIANASSVTLRWDAVSPTPDGYRIYAREAGQAYDYSDYAWQGSTVTCTINNIDDQVDNYFVVRAYDSALESANSNEVHLAASNSVDYEPDTDTTPPSWDGSTEGIGTVVDTGTGDGVTVEFDTATDTVDRTNLKFNVYYAASGSWSNSDWDLNSVVADAVTKRGSTFSHAVILSGLTRNVKYTFGVQAEDQSGNEDANTRTLTAIPTVWQTAGTYNLMLSEQPDRSGSIYLDDAGVEGNIYVFVEPTTNIQKVEFFINGVLEQTESYEPYDLAGGASNNANPFNAEELGNGYHTFSARITKTNGSNETISADVHLFDTDSESSEPAVSNPVPDDSQSAYTQWVSTAENRSNPDGLDGATVTKSIYVFVEPVTDIKQVEFLIDGKLQQTEKYAPYDLAGGASAIANPFDTRSLNNGSHTFTAQITKTNGSLETITADVIVE
jgi:hypothetical protein